MLLGFVRRPNFFSRLWNPPFNVWMFAGSAQELKGTKAAEGTDAFLWKHECLTRRRGLRPVCSLESVLVELWFVFALRPRCCPTCRQKKGRVSARWRTDVLPRHSVLVPSFWRRISIWGHRCGNDQQRNGSSLTEEAVELPKPPRNYIKTSSFPSYLQGPAEAPGATCISSFHQIANTESCSCNSWQWTCPETKTRVKHRNVFNILASRSSLLLLRLKVWKLETKLLIILLIAKFFLAQQDLLKCGQSQSEFNMTFGTASQNATAQRPPSA